MGFIIPLSEREKIEKVFNRKFHYDAIQQTHVLFTYDENLRIYIEYICQEGRAAKQKAGFAHICYNLKDPAELEKIESLIKENQMGYRLTELEKSGSQECGMITFYFIKNQGIVEFNLIGKEQASLLQPKTI